jgi:hypothetical protein
MKTNYLIKVNHENKKKLDELMKIFALTVSLENRLSEQLKNIEKNNFYLDDTLCSILNDYKTISSNLYPK